MRRRADFYEPYLWFYTRAGPTRSAGLTAMHPFGGLVGMGRRPPESVGTSGGLQVSITRQDVHTFPARTAKLRLAHNPRLRSTPYSVVCREGYTLPPAARAVRGMMRAG